MITIHIIILVVGIFMLLMDKVMGSYGKILHLPISVRIGIIFSLLYIVGFWSFIFLKKNPIKFLEYTYLAFSPLVKYIDKIPDKEIENLLWGFSLPLLWGIIGFVLAVIVTGIMKFLRGSKKQNL